jgi:hypothetical protein
VLCCLGCCLPTLRYLSHRIPLDIHTSFHPVHSWHTTATTTLSSHHVSLTSLPLPSAHLLPPPPTSSPPMPHPAQRWLVERSSCPHCRSPLSTSRLVKCRFAEDMSSEIDRIEVPSVHSSVLLLLCSMEVYNCVPHLSRWSVHA